VHVPLVLTVPHWSWLEFIVVEPFAASRQKR
jgi:hypothetical protein